MPSTLADGRVQILETLEPASDDEPAVLVIEGVRMKRVERTVLEPAIPAPPPDDE